MTGDSTVPQSAGPAPGSAASGRHGASIDRGLWIGAVFHRQEHGGNLTGVVLDHCADPAALATELGFPDTAFVVRRSGREVDLRTYSPYEELALCLQTTLATPIALGAQHGETWSVRHPAATLEVEVEKADDSWLCWTTDTDTRDDPVPVLDVPRWLPPWQVHRVRQARSRLYVRLPAITELPSFDEQDIQQWCRATGCTGVVFFAVGDGDVVRSRVFTLSLQGAEDAATGGAAAGVGHVLTREGRAGRVHIVQGSEETDRQGHLYVTLGPRRRVGGLVRTLNRLGPLDRSTAGS